MSAEAEQMDKELEELNIRWNEAQKNWGKSFADQISKVQAEYSAVSIVSKYNDSCYIRLYKNISIR